ncbi:hypothetical protein [Xenorhabdus sp. IM139775]|uniref:hypothetical protein n=1 Tax=Xenorhabdus sp. IM139775 TaxID=3025876 RepID=UPI0023598158|nr:hypothetical protein [Xenorhabdus sp. IM139775]MDC9593206.1 hypothetical protein [Xenorhabdus sp. IM139775]
MPFLKPFKEKFEVGDLIFGLDSVRSGYIAENPAFLAAKIHFHKKDNYPPISIDQYLTLAEIYQGMNTEIYIKKQREAEESIDDRYINAVNRFNGRLNYNSSEKFRKYRESFKSHLNKHPKYNTVLTDFEYNRQYLGRKCKGGLSFVCENNDPSIVKDVHFILDDIEYERVVYKLDTNITGKELRFLYRNRNNPNISRKVQFWICDKPTSPPWENEGNNLWKNYITQKERESTMAGIANLLGGIRK